jgi:hypothetical protein
LDLRQAVARPCQIGFDVVAQFGRTVAGLARGRAQQLLGVGDDQPQISHQLSRPGGIQCSHGVCSLQGLRDIEEPCGVAPARSRHNGHSGQQAWRRDDRCQFRVRHAREAIRAPSEPPVQ